MTEVQKAQAVLLRKKGMGYKKIAAILGVSRDAVRNCIKRNAVQMFADGFCRQCGMKIKSVEGKKKKQFCSDGCRAVWWNSHRDMVRHRYESVCQFCGKGFSADRMRKFCSAECYFKYRFHRGDA